MPSIHGPFRRRLMVLLLLTAFPVLLFAAPPGRKPPKEMTEKPGSSMASGTTMASGSSDLSAGSDESEMLSLPRFFRFWQKERLKAKKRGYEWYLQSSGEYYQTLEDPTGERNRSYYHDVYLELTMDLRKIRKNGRGKLFLSVVGGKEKIFSSSPAAEEFQSSGEGPSDTIPGSGGSIQLYELWYEQPFGKAQWLLGLRDLSSDFCWSRFSDALTNVVFWFNPAISGNVPLGIYDFTTLGVRLRYDPSERVQVTAGLFEGTPGTSETNPNGMRWRFGSDEGLFRIAEIRLANPFGKRNPDGNLKLGTWCHTGSFDDLRNFDDAGLPLSRRENWGSYVAFDQTLIPRKGDSGPGLGVFCIAAGKTPNDRSPTESSFGVGFTLSAPFRGRDSDNLSVGFGRNFSSSALREFNQANEEDFLIAERVFEIGYQFQIAPGLTLRPDLQFIQNLEGNPAKSHTRYFSLRCTAVF